MKISTKSVYGLRAMFELALQHGGERLSANSIAERQNISIGYLEQVFSSLKKAGIIRSEKGAQGGYVLSAPPSEIKIGTILRALEGDLFDIDSYIGSNINPIDAVIGNTVWARLKQSINEIVDSITLYDLVETYEKQNQSAGSMYYI